jgi:oxygen-dependent protoporphyrinogen oxidase
MAELVEALVPRLEARLLTGRGALRLERAGGAGYRVHLDGGELLEADAVILTTPAYSAAELAAPVAPGLAEGLRAIRYVSTGIATLAFRRDEVGAPIDGFGLVIPRSEGRRINACTLTSVKFDGRAPEQALLVRVFFGGSDTPETMRLDDEALLALVRDELRATLGISAAPLWTRIYRWWDSNPQYDLGHLDLVDRLDALCPPGLLLAGSAYRGVGIPDCIRQGRRAAERAAALVGAPR